MVVLVASAASAIAASRCPASRPAKARFRTVAWVSTTCRTDAMRRGVLIGLVASLRGMRELPDGTTLVELPGPASYSAPPP
jgi:hypothetical protein